MNERTLIPRANGTLQVLTAELAHSEGDPEPDFVDPHFVGAQNSFASLGRQLVCYINTASR